MPEEFHEAEQRRLLELANAGDESAWGRLLDGYRDLVAGRARRMLPAVLQARESTSDLVQQTLKAAYKARHQFRGDDPKQVRSWLLVILSHRLKKAMARHVGAAKRSVRREAPLPRDLCSDSGLDTAYGELRSRLDRAVAELPEDGRTLLRHRFEEKKPFAEIARLLGTTPNGARMRCARLLAQLRDKMPKD